MHYHAMIEEPTSGLFTTDQNSGKLHVFNFRVFIPDAHRNAIPKGFMSSSLIKPVIFSFFGECVNLQ